jgi:hypothetical protein
MMMSTMTAAARGVARGPRGCTQLSSRCNGAKSLRAGVALRSSSSSVRGGAVRVRAGWLLKNSGARTTDHLGEGEEVEIPGDLQLLAARMVVGRQASDSVSLEISVATVSGAHAMIEVGPDKVGGCYSLPGVRSSVTWTNWLPAVIDCTVF